MNLLDVLIFIAIGFVLPSIMMGVGIGIDVTLGTVARFKDTTLSFQSWTKWIMATHILFPAAGYYGFWWLAHVNPGSEKWLGIVGFLLVLLFIYEVFCEAIDKEPIIGISAALSAFVSLFVPMDEKSSRRWIAILAVSWDALWSGPAKAAQAAAGEWSDALVAISFVIAAATVGLMAHYSLKGAFWLRQRKFSDVSGMTRFNVWAKFAEYSVIGGFGVLSLWHGLTGGGTIWLSITAAAILVGVAFIWFRKELIEHERSEAEETICGDVATA